MRTQRVWRFYQPDQDLLALTPKAASFCEIAPMEKSFEHIVGHSNATFRSTSRWRSERTAISSPSRAFRMALYVVGMSKPAQKRPPCV